MERNKFAGKTPAPIFSKKPRQALFAHPNNSNSTNFHNGSYSGITGRTNCHNYGPNQNITSSVNHERQNHIVKQPQAFSLNIDTNQSNPRMNNMYQHENKPMDNNYLGQSSMSDIKCNLSQRHYAQPQANINDLGRRTLSSRNVSNGRSCSNSEKNNQNRLIQSLQQTSQRLSSQCDPSSYTCYNPQTNPVQTSRLQQQQPYFNFQPPGFGQTFEKSPAIGCQPYDDAVVPEYNSGWKYGPVRNNTTCDMGNKQPNDAQVSKQLLQDSSLGNSEFKILKKETENSLRMVTTSIQGIKQWLGHTNKIPVIFEIFGNMNSAVTSGTYPDAREFCLKDDKDVLKCIFYQMDREVPRLVRGQWYRCTGKWTNNEESLLCLSIRQATEEERKVYRLRINAADRALRAWKLKNSEF